MQVRFNVPPRAGRELEYIAQAIENGRLSGNGEFTQKCQNLLRDLTGAGRVLLTTSCTDALEMCAILAGIGPGDEVIMPSFTFVSTANAFVLRGATPVFVDITQDTLNIDPERVLPAITPRTKAIVAVHYAGVPCDMLALRKIADDHGLILIEDAAQALMSKTNGTPLGSIGDLAALSFHETKNIVCGEGGALLINREDMYERAEIIWEKGTNRSRFFRGEVDKYTWVDIGSSFLPSELQAAFLLAQLEQAEAITQRRLQVWNRYYDRLVDLQRAGLIRLPVLPADSVHNGHLFYVLLTSADEQARVLSGLNAIGIKAVFHYLPLHSAPAGKVCGVACGTMRVTDELSERLLRLPMYDNLDLETVDMICEMFTQILMQSTHI